MMKNYTKLSVYSYENTLFQDDELLQSEISEFADRTMLSMWMCKCNWPAWPSDSDIYTPIRLLIPAIVQYDLQVLE